MVIDGNNAHRYKVNLMGELKSILLATDGSDNSMGAVKEAINFAGACHTVLSLLRVLEIDPAYESMGFHYTEEMRQAALSDFDEIRELAAYNNVECDIVIRRSHHAHEAIIAEAKDKKSDLIIMGRHGMTGLKKLILGSVTAKVIASASSKVLIVPREVDIRGENILLATDGSKCSQSAEEEAINMAKRCPVVKNLLAVSVASHKDKLSEAQEILDGVRKRASAKGIKAETLALVGEPYKAIVNASLECSADVVIMGTHGRTGLANLLMGSVAERVVALSMCSVLVVKNSPVTSGQRQKASVNKLKPQLSQFR
ncbi:MAG: universal stress protein [Nitrospirae bacterium]|nr:universal stress protein [Nitrospirota bacterium]